MPSHPHITTVHALQYKNPGALMQYLNVSHAPLRPSVALQVGKSKHGERQDTQDRRAKDRAGNKALHRYVS